MAEYRRPTMPQATPAMPSGGGGSGSRPAAIIDVQGLGKTYRVADKQPGLAGTIRHFLLRRTRDVQAVRDVSFQIQPGEMVGFLGANGAGKTTTLKMLCGLIHPIQAKHSPLRWGLSRPDVPGVTPAGARPALR